MPYHFSGLVAARRPDLRLQLMRITTEARFMCENKSRKSFLHVEWHQSLAGAILAQTRL